MTLTCVVDIKLSSTATLLVNVSMLKMKKIVLKEFEASYSHPKEKNVDPYKV